jgi:hypothetical protein
MYICFVFIYLCVFTVCIYDVEKPISIVFFLNYTKKDSPTVNNLAVSTLIWGHKITRSRWVICLLQQGLCLGLSLNWGNSALPAPGEVTGILLLGYSLTSGDNGVNTDQ